MTPAIRNSKTQRQPKVSNQSSAQVLERVNARAFLKRVIFHPLSIAADHLKLHNEPTTEWRDRNPYDFSTPPPGILYHSLNSEDAVIPIVRAINRGKHRPLFVSNKSGLDWASHKNSEIDIDWLARREGERMLLQEQIRTVPLIVMDMLTATAFQPRAYSQEWRIRFLQLLEGINQWLAIPIETPDEAGVAAFLDHIKTTGSLLKSNFCDTTIGELNNCFRIKPSTKSKFKSALDKSEKTTGVCP